MSIEELTSRDGQSIEQFLADTKSSQEVLEFCDAVKKERKRIIEYHVSEERTLVNKQISRYGKTPEMVKLLEVIKSLRNAIEATYTIEKRLETPYVQALLNMGSDKLNLVRRVKNGNF